MRDTVSISGFPFALPYAATVLSVQALSGTGRTGWTDYLDALCGELAFDWQSGPQKEQLNTYLYRRRNTDITFGTGSWNACFAFVDEHFDRSRLLEYTVEAGRPDSITREKLEVMKKHGVTRISVNPQTMQQKTLDLIGRKHTVEEM